MSNPSGYIACWVVFVYIGGNMGQSYCNKHHKAGCKCGRHGYRGIEDAILEAMKRAREEDGRTKLFPHEVLIYIEDAFFCHYVTIRHYMAELAKAGKLARLGKRGGYQMVTA